MKICDEWRSNPSLILMPSSPDTALWGGLQKSPDVARRARHGERGPCSTVSTGRDCRWDQPSAPDHSLRMGDGMWNPGPRPGAEALFDLINALKLGR